MRGIIVVRAWAVGFGLVALCVAGAACSERNIVLGAGGASGAGGARAFPPGWQVLSNVGAGRADVLVMVDDSASMKPLQPRLTEAFPAFVQRLQMAPNGPPDLHVAVISSDTGPGKFDLPSYGCPFIGDRGAFQSAARGSCTSSPLAPGQHFLASAGVAVNFMGGLGDAFTCIAQLGDQGCGFEGPLKSVRWALDPLNVPDGNQGFLRTDSVLAVVLLTNEDDCSVPDDSDLFDPRQTRMSDPLGPFNSFRCNEFGHLCNINGTLQPPPRGAADDLTGCISNETLTGRLTRVGDEVSFLKSLKSDPNRILVAAIAGPTAPYGIEMVNDPAGGEAHPSMKHSCQTATGEYADPPVRIKQWADNFGNNGMMESICDATLTPVLTDLATKIGNIAGGRCVLGPYTTSGLSNQPDCRVVDGQLDPGNVPVGELIPNCVDNGGAARCWTMVDDPASCPVGGKQLQIDLKGGRTPNGLIATCQPCPTDHAELGCLLSPHTN